MPKNLAHHELAWRWVWLAVGSGLPTGAAVTVLLWGHTTADHRAAFDAGWRTSAAVLAIFAVFLAVGRLRLSQREHARQLVADQAARAEAVERQITELAAKASDQLGSDSEATRIGGLVALERLAQTHVDLRQTAVDQICAYLRQPLASPNRDDAGGKRELSVRRTAQQVLKRHLSWPVEQPQPDTFWDAIHLDLSDAVLVDFDLADCRVTYADFGQAQFHGTVRLTGAAFSSIAYFGRARFTAWAHFHGVRFADRVSFRAAKFHDTARFDHATFANEADFPDTSFDLVSFDHVTFGGEVRFSGANFERAALFNGVVLTGATGFADTTFTGLATFQGARFVGAADFAGSKFDGEPRMFLFNNATIVDPKLDHVWPRAFRILPDNPQPDGLGRLFLDVSELPPDERIVVGL